jgi:hypothetical protein
MQRMTRAPTNTITSLDSDFSDEDIYYAEIPELQNSETPELRRSENAEPKRSEDAEQRRSWYAKGTVEDALINSLFHSIETIKSTE